MWLRDSLPNDLEGARIALYGYDSRLKDSNSFQDLEALASALRTTLKALKDVSTTHGQTIPLVFVAHGLGGLMLKEAIIQMKRSHAHHSLLDSIYGIAFFGVPSQGMDISSMVPMAGDRPNQSLLQSLGKESQLLRNQCRDFPKAFSHHDSEIICFYGTEMSHTAVQVRSTVLAPRHPLV